VYRIPWLKKRDLLSGWWLTYLSEKYESQLGSLFPTYGFKKKKQPPTSYDLVGKIPEVDFS